MSRKIFGDNVDRYLCRDFIAYHSSGNECRHRVAYKLKLSSVCWPARPSDWRLLVTERSLLACHCFFTSLCIRIKRRRPINQCYDAWHDLMSGAMAAACKLPYYHWLLCFLHTVADWNSLVIRFNVALVGVSVNVRKLFDNVKLLLKEKRKSLINAKRYVSGRDSGSGYGLTAKNAL